MSTEGYGATFNPLINKSWLPESEEVVARHLENAEYPLHHAVMEGNKAMVNNHERFMSTSLASVESTCAHGCSFTAANVAEPNFISTLSVVLTSVLCPPDQQAVFTTIARR